MRIFVQFQSPDFSYKFVLSPQHKQKQRNPTVWISAVFALIAGKKLLLFQGLSKGKHPLNGNLCLRSQPRSDLNLSFTGFQDMGELFQ